MNRVHFFEFIDQSWCPQVIRDGITDGLQFFLCVWNRYGCVAGKIQETLNRIGSRRILDLCSGGGGPWLKLYQTFEKDSFSIDLCLSDKFPNTINASRIREKFHGKSLLHPEPVDVMKIPSELEGFRTLFTSFHHFKPDQAKMILKDAVENKQGIGIFEFTHRSFFCIFSICFSSIFHFIMSPFIKPFKWSRLILTYLIPIIPIVATFDGIVSCFRTYSPDELRSIAADFNDEYTWEAGEIRTGMLPVPITYLIGYPEQK